MIYLLAIVIGNIIGSILHPILTGDPFSLKVSIITLVVMLGLCGYFIGLKEMIDNNRNNY